MRRLATSFTVFALLISTVSIAQKFSFSASESYISGPKTETAFQKPITIYNNSGNTLQMQWEVIFEETIGPMVPTHCDPEKCHPPSTTSNKFTFDTVFAVTDYINVHFYPNGDEGACTSAVLIYEQGDRANGDTLIFYGKTTGYNGNYIEVDYSKDPTSSLENTQEMTSIISQNYPNPVIDNTTINFSFSENLINPKLIIINILGDIVQEQSLNEDFINLNIGLKSGIYFYSIWNNNTKISTTKKMTVK